MCEFVGSQDCQVVARALEESEGYTSNTSASFADNTLEVIVPGKMHIFKTVCDLRYSRAVYRPFLTTSADPYYLLATACRGLKSPVRGYTIKHADSGTFLFPALRTDKRKVV